MAIMTSRLSETPRTKMHWLAAGRTMAPGALAFSTYKDWRKEASEPPN
jgi:hypothetical protein